MGCYSTAWLISDTLKSIVALSMVAISSYQLSYAFELSLQFIESMSLSAGALSFALFIGAHEPGYFGWRTVLVFTNLYVTSLMVCGSYITYRITFAYYSSNRLEMPNSTRIAFFGYVIFSTGLAMASLFVSLADDQLKWTSLRMMGVGSLFFMCGVHFEYSLFVLRRNFVHLTQATSIDVSRKTPGPLNNKRTSMSSRRPLGKKRNMSIVLKGDENSGLVYDGSPQWPRRTQRSDSKSYNPQTIVQSENGATTFSRSEPVEPHENLDRSRNTRTNSHGGVQNLKVASEALQRTLRWIRKIDNILVFGAVLIVLVVGISCMYAVITLQSDMSYSEATEREICNYSFGTDALQWVSAAVNCFFVYYTSGNRRETLASRQQTPAAST